MHRNDRILILVLFFLNVIIVNNSGFTQEVSIAITLQESISYGLKNSPRMQLSRQELDRSEKTVEATKAGLKSYLDLTTNIPSYSSEVEGIKDIGGITHYAFTKNLKYQSILSFHQPLPTSGRFSLNYDFYYHQQKGNLVNYSNDIFVRFVQPIFTSNTIKRNIKWSEINLARSHASYTNQQFDFIQEVISNFYNFYRTDLDLKVQQEEIQQRRFSYEDAKERFEKGTINEYEVLKLQIELMRSQELYYKKKSIRDHEASDFKTLIGLSNDTEVAPITDLHFIPITVDINRAIDLGMQNNPDLVSALYYIEIRKLYSKYVDTWSEFRGYIFFTYGLEKVDPIVRNSFRDFAQSRSIMINLSIPLWDWGRQNAYVSAAKSDMHSAELNLMQQQQRVSSTIRNTVRQIEETARRLENLQNIAKQAQHNYELVRDKFIQRQVSVDELILTMQQWTSARSKYTSAFINYEISKARLKGLTQWDFEKNEKVDTLYSLVLSSKDIQR